LSARCVHPFPSVTTNLTALDGNRYTKANTRLDPSQPGYAALKLHSNLRKLVIGQEEAIAQIVDVYQSWLAGLTSPGRPIGSFLFLGPTGTGKTRIVEAVAELLLGHPQAIVRIDCAEFQQSHEVAKLIGSPPGYLGHRETHPVLCQEALSRYQDRKARIGLVLFDEIEKASEALWNLLLGILDKATLTLGDNRKVDFSLAMIFMTSNLDAAGMESLITPSLGFAASEIAIRPSNSATDENLNRKLARAGVEALRRKFPPELVNRIDKIAVFKPLGAADLDRILSIELDLLQKRVLASLNASPFVFKLSPEARAYLLREGTNARYGARHLKRTIERTMVHPLANLMASYQIRSGDFIKIDFDPESGSLVFIKEAEQLPACTMSEMIAILTDSRVGNATGRPLNRKSIP